MTVFRFTDPKLATDPDMLSEFTGPIRSVEKFPLIAAGETAGQFERLEITLQTAEKLRFVVKRINPAKDWTAQRTGDSIGREASMLAEPGLDPIWEAFMCPYLAYSTAPGQVAIVMEDLTPFLFSDTRDPLHAEEQEILLHGLAKLHARFWASPILDLPWLTQPQHYAGLLDVDCANELDVQSILPNLLRDSVSNGWASAFKHLPSSVKDMLSAPASEISWLWNGLPRTLLHGDAEIANFALLPNQKLAAFDWAMIGSGPATFDIAWYLAVNSTRLARTREQTLERYRVLLVRQLASPLPELVWKQFKRAGIIVGARMSLWSKALAVEADRPGAQAEWDWWVENLEAACG